MKTLAKDNLGVCRVIMRKCTILWCKDIGSWQLYSLVLFSKKLKIMFQWRINGKLFQLAAAPETLFYLGCEKCLQPECIKKQIIKKKT